MTRRSIKTKNSEHAEKEAQELLDKLYHEVRAQRFEDIVVLQTKFNADPRFMILANAFNLRHLVNGTTMLNRQYKLEFKKEDQSFANMSISEDWNVLDFHSVVVHLLSKSCRERFDIEQLWAVGEKYDDHINFPGKIRSSSSAASGIDDIPDRSAVGDIPTITLDGMSIPSRSST